MRACKVLPVDAVFETTLKDFRSRNVGVLEASGASIEFALTDCKTGELLWRSDDAYLEARGFLVKPFVTKWSSLCATAIRFPYHKKRKK
jgi:hypothetical protein